MFLVGGVAVFTRVRLFVSLSMFPTNHALFDPDNNILILASDINHVHFLYCTSPVYHLWAWEKKEAQLLVHVCMYVYIVTYLARV